MKTTNPIANTEQLVADLAWEYCEERRAGHLVRMADYLKECPDQASRVAFKELVNTDLLLGLALQERENG